MKQIGDLTVKIFADGADVASIRALSAKAWIKGFTTNPTLMRKAGVGDYRAFARDVLDVVRDRPVSFEVLSDELEEMERQAREIATWGANVNVKIPVTNTRGESAAPLVHRLARAGVVVNVTAVFTLEQVKAIVSQLVDDTPAIISIFAGRVADTGTDPVPVMREALGIMEARPRAELLWASPREVLNVVQANDIGCHIITVTDDLLAKLPLLGRSHEEYSRDTVAMFHRDALAAGYRLVPTVNPGDGSRAGGSIHHEESAT